MGKGGEPKLVKITTTDGEVYSVGPDGRLRVDGLPPTPSPQESPSLGDLFDLILSHRPAPGDEGADPWVCFDWVYGPVAIRMSFIARVEVWVRG